MKMCQIFSKNKFVFCTLYVVNKQCLTKGQKEKICFFVF